MKVLTDIYIFKTSDDIRIYFLKYIWNFKNKYLYLYY